MSERRAQHRYPLQLSVDLLPLDDPADSALHGQTHDVSINGFYLIGGPQLLEEGSSVELALWLPVGAEGQETGIRGQGRVVRVDRGVNEQIGVAVKFDRIEFTSGDVETFT